MPYLTITRVTGDPDRLADAYERSAHTMTGVGRDHGLILHAAAKTPDGVTIVNLWPSRDGSETAARDPRRLAALRESGVGPEDMSREHHEVLDYTIFDRG